MTNGYSGKLKLVALLTTIIASTITVVAAIDPSLLTPVAWAAVGAYVTAISGAVGAYYGKPGDVTEVVGDPSDDGLGDEAKDLLKPVPVVPPAQAGDA